MTDTIRFPYEEWAVLRKPDGEIASVRPVKGSWTLLGGEDRRRMAGKGINVKGLLSCPNCGQASLIPENFNPPKKLGDGRPHHKFVCHGCMFDCFMLLQEWDKRKLYCACYETREGDSLKPHKEYLHAEDDREAHKFFWASHGREVTNLIGIAPALGFFAEDPSGAHLSVDPVVNRHS